MSIVIRVKKYNEKSRVWSNLLRKIQIQEPLHMLIANYGGFEGEEVDFYKSKDISRSLDRPNSEDDHPSTQDLLLLQVIAEPKHTVDLSGKSEGTFVGL